MLLQGRFWRREEVSGLVSVRVCVYVTSVSARVVCISVFVFGFGELGDDKEWKGLQREMQRGRLGRYRV